MKIDFDKRFFRALDYLRIFLKKILTRLGLRNKQSCRYCGRNQKIVWNVKNELWSLLPKKYSNECLCLECFLEICPYEIKKEDFNLLDFSYFLWRE